MAKFVEHAVLALARRFHVRRVGDHFAIRAEGLYLGRPLAKELTDEDQLGDLLGGYAALLRRGAEDPKAGKRLPQIRFANGRTEEALMNFLRDFGWLEASIWSIRHVRRRTSKGKRVEFALVRQSRSALLVGQRRFEALARLVAALQAVPVDVEGVEESINLLTVGGWRPPRPSLPEAVIQHGHGMALSILSKFPPRLVASHRGKRWIVEEIPYQKDGLKWVLYGLLRRDYLSGFSGRPRIGICRNDKCHDVFAVERKGQKFCDGTCSRQARQRDYYNKRGRRLRRERLGKASSRQDEVS
jgi:hypothetical protein